MRRGYNIQVVCPPGDEAGLGDLATEVMEAIDSALETAGIDDEYSVPIDRKAGKLYATMPEEMIEPLKLIVPAEIEVSEDSYDGYKVAVDLKTPAEEVWPRLAEVFAAAGVEPKVRRMTEAGMKSFIVGGVIPEIVDRLAGVPGVSYVMPFYNERMPPDTIPAPRIN